MRSLSYFMPRIFFKKVYKIKDLSPSDFDLVINFDFIKEAESAARIVETAFRERFGEEPDQA